MPRSIPLKPRSGRVLHVLVVARISGCQNQKEVSLEDQVDHAKAEIADLYDGPAEFYPIATKGKGERLDRPELEEVENQIRDGLIDVVFMEDVGRMVRGTAAVQIWGLAADRGIRCLAPNDGCDTAEETWEEDLISACREHVSHCAHTSRRIKKKQMSRFRRDGGALPVQIAGYIKPEGAKHYSELRKDESAEKFLRGGLDVLRRTLNWSAVADYFNDQGFPTGPYTRKNEWDGSAAKRLYKNPILVGRPQRGAFHSVKNHETGRREAQKNPDGPTYRDEPHLAFFEREELEPVLLAVTNKHKKLGRSKGLLQFEGSRKRTRFPGRCAVCYYCGRPMLWGGNGVTDTLICKGAREYRCWNSFTFSGTRAATLVVDAIRQELLKLEGFHAQFRELIEQAQQRSGVTDDEWSRLSRDEDDLRRQKEHLKKLIYNGRESDFLEELLEEVESSGEAIMARRRELERRAKNRPNLPSTVQELGAEFEKRSQELAVESFEMADILREIVTSFHVYLVQQLDSPQLVPRAQVELSLGGIIGGFSSSPEASNLLTKTITLDLFDPPGRIRLREECVRLTVAKWKQRDIAAELGTHQATVQRAITLNRLMQESGLSEPYRMVEELPENVSRHRFKRTLHKRYRFEAEPGFVRPELSDSRQAP
uniref:Resolvase/invertase-type recombinase catalytic domain-containing protein n=1 Tax=Rubinisphaera brasiliensis (strain ATCC 49424 / DSM 5305 / JCM 21570 / IAM 15109 / NBRC 103401 / IFAM 1448) TaxID=756272 RepID=F0SR73_RUBBR|nr:hypothetical protein Plabr_3730 [Rubinisphaera brasiliensis DSM 5305]